MEMSYDWFAARTAFKADKTLEMIAYRWLLNHHPDSDYHNTATAIDHYYPGGMVKFVADWSHPADRDWSAR